MPRTLFLPAMPRYLLTCLLFCLPLCLMARPAWADMTIEIVGGAENKVPIAILPFFTRLTGLANPAEIVSNDLNNSGFFKLIESRYTFSPENPNNFQLAPWKARGADAVLIGQIMPTGKNQVEVQFRLLDSVRQVVLTGFAFTVAPSQLRAVSHKIADAVHQALLGEAGNYSGRVAYVLKQGGHYELQVADVDGYGAQWVVRQKEPLISPTWSRDGKYLAYVSFEKKKPVVHVLNLADGSSRMVANFRGSNAAPAWSPDGRKLAVALSKDATSQIYFLDLDSGKATRVTQGGHLDTEPVFSPDGEWLYFTSDRGGNPQIYKAPVAGGEARRVTFVGAYNVSPTLSPDGKSLAYVHRVDGGFHIAVQDLASGQMQVLTDSQHDESPSFSPNGMAILYATRINGRNILATTSVDGRIKQRLSLTGDLREPAWGP
jgi:TolB protein